jgi:hypothetical protein
VSYKVVLPPGLTTLFDISLTKTANLVVENDTICGYAARHGHA